MSDDAGDLGGKGTEARGKLVREIAGCLGIMGLLLVVLGGLAWSHIASNAAPLYGMPRRVFLGASLLSLGAIQVGCGALFFATRRTLFAVVGAISMAVVALMGFVISGVSLITCLLGAVPVLLGQRLSMLVKTKPDSGP